MRAHDLGVASFGALRGRTPTMTAETYAVSARQEREQGALADLAAGMSVYQVALRRALSLRDVERLRDGVPLPVHGLCRADGCDQRAFRSGWCQGHTQGYRAFLHRGTKASR